MASSNEAAPQSERPPAYDSRVRTVHDQTHRGIWHMQPTIASMGNRPNLIGHLDRYSWTTDGSFSICVAGGVGVFISEVSNTASGLPMTKERSFRV